MDENMNDTGKSDDPANPLSKGPALLQNRDMQEIRAIAARRTLPEEIEIDCVAEIDKERRRKHDEDAAALRAKNPKALIQPYVAFTIKNVFASREESIKGRRFWHIVSDDGRKYTFEAPGKTSRQGQVDQPLEKDERSITTPIPKATAPDKDEANPTAEAPKRKVFEKLKMWAIPLGIVLTVLSILATLVELPEKFVKMTGVFWSKPEGSIENTVEVFSYLRVIVVDSTLRLPLEGVLLRVEELPVDTVLTGITTSDGGYHFRNVPAPINTKVRVYAERESYRGKNLYTSLPGPLRFELEKIK